LSYLFNLHIELQHILNHTSQHGALRHPSLPSV